MSVGICCYLHSYTLFKIKIKIKTTVFTPVLCSLCVQFSKAILTNYLLEALYSGAMPVLLFCISVYIFCSCVQRIKDFDQQTDIKWLNQLCKVPKMIEDKNKNWTSIKNKQTI